MSENTGKEEEGYTGFFIEGIQQYSQFFMDCNWYDFSVIRLDIEDDRCMGGFEIAFVILGLGFRARWNYRETERVSEIKQHAAEIMRKLNDEGA